MTDRDAFFPSVAALDPAEALSRCLERLAHADEEVASLKKERAETPRGDKQKANRLLGEIGTLDSFRRRLGQIIKHYRGLVERQESQFLWSTAVREVCGQDKLAECYAWMKTEKRRRAAVAIGERGKG